MGCAPFLWINDVLSSDYYGTAPRSSSARRREVINMDGIVGSFGYAGMPFGEVERNINASRKGDARAEEVEIGGTEERHSAQPHSQGGITKQLKTDSTNRPPRIGPFSRAQERAC
jgi:hypothetical protein